MDEKELAVTKDVLRGREPRILYLDLETTPILSWAWEAYETNLLEIEQDSRILCFAWAWEGENEIHFTSVRDAENYTPNRFNINDRVVVDKLWDLFNEADIIIGQNSNNFDIRTANARFLYYFLPPPKPYQTVDTLIVARRYFRMPMHKLDQMLRYLNMDRKLPTEGKDLWLNCMNGDDGAWEKMQRYNENDVKILIDLYKRMRGWHKNHPNLALFTRKNGQCPVCTSPKVRKEGKRYLKTGWKYRWSCQSCGKWWNTELEREKPKLDIVME